MKKLILMLLCLLLLTACGAKTDKPLADGIYTAEVTMEGGSGRASIESPAQITIADGVCTARIVWSSPYYDFMVVEEETLSPVNTDGNSVFEIPVPAFDEPLNVQADTVAMSQPHLIDYTFTFHADTLEAVE